MGAVGFGAGVLVLAGVALAGRRAAGVGVGAALLGWRALLGLRGARCWACAAAGFGVAHSRLWRVAARAGIGRCYLRRSGIKDLIPQRYIQRQQTGACIEFTDAAQRETLCESISPVRICMW